MKEIEANTSTTIKHNTELVTWGKFSAQIDVGIAPLIYEIWRAGLQTIHSCEENWPGLMWIGFMTTRHAELFINTISHYEDGIDTLYNRIQSRWRFSDGSSVDGEWQYSAIPYDHSVTPEEIENGVPEDKYINPGNFKFILSIAFPKIDYPILLERMIAFNNAGTA